MVLKLYECDRGLAPNPAQVAAPEAPRVGPTPWQGLPPPAVAPQPALRPDPKALAGVSPTLATKHDSNKPPLSLISRCALEAEGRVLAHGCAKYAPDNWRQGFAWRRLIDAALRHVYALADGEDRDPETGELHTAHARCMLAFLHEHIERGLGVDDRYPPPTPPLHM